MEKAKLARITIVEATEIVGKPVRPGDEFAVPNEVTEKDAYTLIGIGKALPGPASAHTAKVQLAVEQAASDAATRAEIKKHSEPVNVRLAKAMELIAAQGESIQALAEQVGKLVALQTQAAVAASGKAKG